MAKRYETEDCEWKRIRHKQRQVIRLIGITKPCSMQFFGLLVAAGQVGKIYLIDIHRIKACIADFANGAMME